MSKKPMFSFSGTQKPAYEVPKGDPFKTAMPTFWAVEEPHVVNDAIPRDIRSTSSNQSGIIRAPQPTATRLGLFSSQAAAVQHAQSLNRPLVIIELKTVQKIMPVLPEVTAYTPPPVEKVTKIDATNDAPKFTNAG